MKFQGGFSILHINFAQLHTVFNYINLFFRSLVCSMVNAGNIYICNSFVQFSHCCVAFILNYLYFSFGLIEILLDVSIFIVICFVAHSWVHWVLKLIETGQTFNFERCLHFKAKIEIFGSFFYFEYLLFHSNYFAKQNQFFYLLICLRFACFFVWFANQINNQFYFQFSMTLLYFIFKKIILFDHL